MQLKKQDSLDGAKGDMIVDAMSLVIQRRILRVSFFLYSC